VDIQEERRSSSSHPCAEILHCLALVECELFSTIIEVRIKIQIELRDKDQTQGGRNFMARKEPADSYQVQCEEYD